MRVWLGLGVDIQEAGAIVQVLSHCTDSMERLSLQGCSWCSTFLFKVSLKRKEEWRVPFSSHFLQSVPVKKDYYGVSREKGWREIIEPEELLLCVSLYRLYRGTE